MSKRCKVRAKYFSAYLIILNVFIITFSSNAKYGAYNFFFQTYQNGNDTSPPKKKLPTKRIVKAPVKAIILDTTKKKARDTIRIADTIRRTIRDTTRRNATDTLRGRDSVRTVQKIDTFDFPVSKDTLEGTISYEASDSGVLLVDSKTFILYGKASTKYTDLELTAATIKLDQDKQLVTAFGAKDTLGNPLEKPKLVQGETISNSDTIYYNLKTQKGLTKSSYLQEGEMFVYANTVKKVSNDVLYAWRGRFTTCNLDTPHFAFRTRKMKIINKKLAVSGPTFPEFEGVPLPIGIPFGIFPLNRGRHSGILAPQLASSEDFGLGLEGLGFYKVLNDYVDATVRSNLYSYGGWNLNLSSRYTKRYRYNGGLNLSIQNTKILNRNTLVKEEFTRNSSFMIGWNHSRYPKAHPGTNFSASVNAGSTKFNQYVPNNAALNFQNQLSSSINYSKDWRGKYNLAVSANHNQNNVSRLINLTLPTVSFSAVTVYPFQKKEQIGQGKWYEKLGIGYSGNLQNQVSFYDSAFNLRKLLDTAQWSATHNIPITLSLPQLGPFNISPGVSYNERWFGQATQAYYDTTTKSVKLKTTRGFYTERETQFSIAANTRIFGTYQFKKTGTIQAIRHEIRPFVSFNYKPDLNKANYSRIQVDSLGTFLPFSNIIGSVSTGDRRFGGISFGIDNTLEMKTRNKKDTSEGATKKIRLIDGFGFSSAYNFLNDSFRLSPFSLSFRSTLFDKINITANGTLDPYKTDAFGRNIDKLAWTGSNPKIGRITNGSVAISTQFRSKTKDGKPAEEQQLPADEFMTADEQMRQLDFVRSNPGEYTDFNIPWSLSLSYSLSFTRQFLPPDYKLRTETYSNVSVNGDFSLTPRWKMGGNTNYDFKTHKIQMLTMFITREMHCWQMSINLTPVGLYRSFNISISPKSGILRDLRINRSRFFYNQ
jgi:hypothetical protein